MNKIGLRKFGDLVFLLIFLVSSVLTIYFSFFPFRPIIFLLGGFTIDITIITIFMSFFSLFISLGWDWYIISGFIFSLYKNKKFKQNGNDPEYKFSILIPARNEENVIFNIISDLRSQTYKNWEAIIICHNCTDETYSVVTKISEEDHRIIPINFKGEYGKPYALNYGVKKISGDLVTIFDADTRIDKDYLEKTLPYFPKYDGVQTEIKASNPKFNILTRLIDLECICFTDLVQCSRSGLGLNAIFGGTGQTIKKQVLESVNFWDNDLVEDYSLSIKIALKNFKIVYVNDIKVYDEKIPYWKQFFKQRARWLRGDYSVTRKYLYKLWKRLDFIHLLLSSFGIFLYLYSYFAIIYYLFGGFLIQFYLPPYIWLSMFLIQHAILIVRIIIARGIAKLIYYPLLFIYLYHWIFTLFYTPFVKTWKISKTEHGFFNKN